MLLLVVKVFGVGRMEDKYSVLEPEFFTKLFKKRIPLEVQNIFRGKFEILKINPYIGKPLGFQFFRELKSSKFRVYYYIYEDSKYVCLVNCGDKKTQKEDIIYSLKTRKYYKDIFANFKYIKETYSDYMSGSDAIIKVMKKDLVLIKERNQFLEECIRSFEDIKLGKYKVL